MRDLLFVAAFCAVSSPAFAQTSEPYPTSSPYAASGISLSAQVSVVYDCGSGNLGILRTSYSDRMLNVAGADERIFSGLDVATRAGLEQAMANGALTGRADVVALAYEVGGDAGEGAPWRPIGIYVYTTEFLRDDVGAPVFRSRLEFHPDASRVTFEID